MGDGHDNMHFIPIKEKEDSLGCFPAGLSRKGIPCVNRRRGS